jgi:hypothetical protein
MYQGIVQTFNEEIKDKQNMKEELNELGGEVESLKKLTE